MAAATRPTAGGTAVRVLLPVAWVLPALLGWLRLAALLAWLAPRLDALDARLANQRRLREELGGFVAMCACTGRIRWRGKWVSVEAGPPGGLDRTGAIGPSKTAC